MGQHRYARKVDSTQREIVSAVRKVGVEVFLIKEPCDVLTYNPRTDVWKPLEIKPPKRVRKDQPKQDDFLSRTRTPRVRSPEEALRALGLIT